MRAACVFPLKFASRSHFRAAINGHEHYSLHDEDEKKNNKIATQQTNSVNGQELLNARHIMTDFNNMKMRPKKTYTQINKMVHTHTHTLINKCQRENSN